MNKIIIIKNYFKKNKDLNFGEGENSFTGADVLNLLNTQDSLDYMLEAFESLNKEEEISDFKKFNYLDRNVLNYFKTREISTEEYSEIEKVINKNPDDLIKYFIKKGLNYIDLILFIFKTYGIGSTTLHLPEFMTDVFQKEKELNRFQILSVKSDFDNWLYKDGWVTFYIDNWVKGKLWEPDIPLDDNPLIRNKKKER